LFPFLNHAVINDYTALHFETLLFFLLCPHCALPFTEYIYILNCVTISTSLYCWKNFNGVLKLTSYKQCSSQRFKGSIAENY